LLLICFHSQLFAPFRLKKEKQIPNRKPREKDHKYHYYYTYHMHAN